MIRMFMCQTLLQNFIAQIPGLLEGFATCTLTSRGRSYLEGGVMSGDSRLTPISRLGVRQIFPQLRAIPAALREYARNTRYYPLAPKDVYHPTAQGTCAGDWRKVSACLETIGMRRFRAGGRFFTMFHCSGRTMGFWYSR